MQLARHCILRQQSLRFAADDGLRQGRQRLQRMGRERGRAGEQVAVVRNVCCRVAQQRLQLFLLQLLQLRRAQPLVSLQLRGVTEHGIALHRVVCRIDYIAEEPAFDAHARAPSSGAVA